MTPNISWKGRLAKMKPGEQISASLKWRDNTLTLQKRLNKFRKLGYLKCLGCSTGRAVYVRTEKQIDDNHFKSKKMTKITESEWLDIQEKALEFTKQNISQDNWELIYNLQRENLKKDLIISKFKV